MSHLVERGSSAGKSGTVVAIGPEGGWVGAELELLQHEGFRLGSVGERIMATGTSVVAVLSVTKAVLGAG